MAEVGLPVLQSAAPRRTPLRVQNLRINNVEIPNNKRIEYSLQYIFGIGHKTAQDILASTVGAASKQQLLQQGLPESSSWMYPDWCWRCM
jgi:hypothetical protein